MKIGIIGTGNMGRSLGLLFAEQGHDVVFGARTPETAAAAAALAPRGARPGSNDDAAEHGEVVLYTLRDVPPGEVLTRADALSGKIVIDCNNRPGPKPAELPGGSAKKYGLAEAPNGPALAERLAAALPGSHVVKAFNTVAQELLELAPDPLRGLHATMILCGDHEASIEVVSALVRALGFVPVVIGPLSNAWLVEALGDVIRIVMGTEGHGPTTAFSLVDGPTATAPRLGGRAAGLQ